MSDPVKRRYDSSRRQGQARLTRHRIIVAATELFVTRGYGATSIAAIAEAAAVSPQTVYASFGTKAGVLGAAVDMAMAGDDEPVAVFDRPEAQGALTARTADAAAAAFARSATALLERAGRLLAAADAAAQTDPELAAMWIAGHKLRLADMRRVTRAFATAGLLQEGLTADAAADQLWAIASPDTFRSFTVIRGWAPRRYERWLAATVSRTILASG